MEDHPPGRAGAVVKELSRRFHAGDIDGARALYHPKVRVKQPDSLPHGGWHHGLEGMDAMSAVFREHWDREITNPRILDCSGTAVQITTQAWTAKATGRAATVEVVELFSVVDDRIEEIRVFQQDTHLLLETLTPQRHDTDDHLWILSPHWRHADDGSITPQRPHVQQAATFATVLFTDIVDSTQREAALGNDAWQALLDRHDHVARVVIEGVDGRLVKHTGDGLLAMFPDPAAAIRATLTLARDLGDLGLPIRAGLHSGLVVLRGDGDGTGIAVNIAERVQAVARAGEVLVSDTVRDLMLGSTYQFTDHGLHQLEGFDSTRRLYAVTRPPSVP